MQNFVLSLEGQFPTIYSQSKNHVLANNSSSVGISSNHSSHSSSISSLSLTNSTAGSSVTAPTSTASEEILPNKLPLKRRLSEFRFGRDGGTMSIGKKHVSTFTTNPFAFDKFKDITTAFTIHLHPDGVILDPGSIGPLPYSHPLTLNLLNSVNTGTLPLELFLTLLEQSHLSQQQLFYDGCVVVGVVEWRPGMTLTIGNVSSGGSRPITSINNHAVQWTRRVSNATNQHNSPATSPEMHKVLLKPTADCWQHALSFMASLPADGEKYARILSDEDSLLEFERQLILLNEPLVCLDPSPMVMFAMNALYFDNQKHRLFHPLHIPPTTSVYDDFDQTLLNFAALKPNRVDPQSPPPPPSVAATTPTVNPRFRRIALIESLQERDKRRLSEPIYGIDHRRQFVKNRQALPQSSFVPANWRPFKTIRYEREITGASITTGTASSSLAKLYYCVNVFYAPPPVFPPIQLFLQVGTSPDTSTSGFLHRLQFPNLIETENYLQNLRNLLLIENGNCNLKVVTDISTTSTGNTSASSSSSANANANGNSGGVGNNLRKAQSQTAQSQAQSQLIQSHQSTQSTQSAQSTQTQQYQLTPHQILQLNQQRSTSATTKDSNNQINKQF